MKCCTLIFHLQNLLAVKECDTCSTSHFLIQLYLALVNKQCPLCGCILLTHSLCLCHPLLCIPLGLQFCVIFAFPNWHFALASIHQLIPYLFPLLQHHLHSFWQSTKFLGNQVGTLSAVFDLVCQGEVSEEHWRVGWWSWRWLCFQPGLTPILLTFKASFARALWVEEQSKSQIVTLLGCICTKILIACFIWSISCSKSYHASWFLPGQIVFIESITFRCWSSRSDAWAFTCSSESFRWPVVSQIQLQMWIP